MAAACLARATRAPGAITTTASLAARSVLAMCSASREASKKTRSIATVAGNHGCGALRKRKNRPEFYTQQPQRRCFFSFFRGSDENDNDEKKENLEYKTQKQNRTLRNAKYNTTTTTTKNDWEDRYRRPITRELWNEFRNEGQRTRDYLSSLSPSLGYQELASELQATINEIWSGPNALDIEPPPECGPTGKWVYKFEVLADSATRVYQRYSSSSGSTSSSASQKEVVLEILPGAEVLAMSLTPDEACVACLLQTAEARKDSPTVKLRSVDSGKEAILAGKEWLRDTIYGASEVVGLEWGPILRLDDETNINFQYSLYLLLADHQGRPDRVVLCQIDPSTLAPTVPPMLIYSSDDPTVMVDVQRTKGCSCVAIRALSKTSSEVFLSPGDTGVTSLVSVRPRQDGVVYHVDVGKEGDVVLLTSDENHPNGGDYFLEETFVSALALSLPPTPTLPKFSENESEFFVEDMDLFRTHIVLYERSRRNGDQRVRVRQRVSTDNPEDGNINSSKPKDTVLDLSSSSLGKHSGSAANEKICLPLHWSKLSPVGNMCFEASFFRFELESLLTPGLVYEYNFDTEQLTMVSGCGGESGSSATEQPEGRSFRNEKVLVESPDGTRVPLSLFYNEEEDEHNNNTNRNQTQTVVLVGYGAYGEPMDLGYNPGWKSLLERGVVVAFAHTRGGGDLGRTWYARGRKEHKLKAIDDYEACAFYLRERFDNKNESLLSPKQEEQRRLSLVAKAFSAGGVLVGASVNRNPGLFDKVILTNAFVDVFSTMGNESLFLTEHEYDEFGNPSADPIVEERIRSYCPIYNLDPGVQVQQTMTQFLLIGTLDDPNVPYWNAALYFRKLLDGFDSTSDIAKGRQPKNDRVFLELQTEGGHHFSGTNRIEVLALENAFILNDSKY